MHKGMGRAQQIRGQKRRNKVLIRSANKMVHKKFILELMQKYGADFDIKKLKPLYQPGEIYWNELINDEVKRIKLEKDNNESTKDAKIFNDSKMKKSQVDVVKPQIRRSKSGSA